MTKPVDPLEYAQALIADREARDSNQLAEFEPYPFQAKMFTFGANYRERFVSAANRVGKTKGGAAECAYHLTGRYPKDWQGRKWIDAIRVLAASGTADQTKSNVQRLLCGDWLADGPAWNGMLPKDAVLSFSRMPGVPAALENVVVRHLGGGQSVINFRSYERGAERIAGDAYNFVWLDEPPPLEFYTEALARLADSDGSLLLTATPLGSNAAEVVSLFRRGDNPRRVVMKASIYDSPRLKDRAKEIEANYPAHERGPRCYGEPAIGRGLLFVTPEDQVTFEYRGLEGFPAHYKHIGAVDLGSVNAAAVAGAFDPETEILWIYRAELIGKRAPTIKQQAEILRSWRLTFGLPQDATTKDRNSGEDYATLYKKEGLSILPGVITADDGGKLLRGPSFSEWALKDEKGLVRYARHLTDLLQARRNCAFGADGEILKTDDSHLQDATRYLIRVAHKGRPINYELNQEAQRSMRPKMAEGCLLAGYGSDHIVGKREKETPIWIAAQRRAQNVEGFRIAAKEQALIDASLPPKVWRVRVPEEYGPHPDDAAIRFKPHFIGMEGDEHGQRFYSFKDQACARLFAQAYGGTLLEQ